MKKGIVDVCKGFYDEARSKHIHGLDYLTQKVNPEPEVIEKNAQSLKARFGAVPGTPFDRHLDTIAYRLTGVKEELSARGIQGTDTVEMAFFSSTPGSTQGIFPAVLASHLIIGQLATSLVPHLVAAEVPTVQLTVEKVKVTETAAQRQLNHIGEGDDLPKTKISRSEGSISLRKYGRMLEMTYESIRMMTLDVVAVMMQRMGAQIGIDETDELIETLIIGDGTSIGAAVVDTDAEVTGTLDYDELVRLFLAFPIGYQMTHCVCNDTNMRTILNMAEFKDPVAGFNFQRNGVLPGPMGAAWHRWTSTGSTSFSTDRILAVDNRAAVMAHTSGDLLEESDRIIDKQIEQRTMSYWRGFSKWDTNATQCLDIT